MTTYNTGNAVGSTDPRDLSDNAKNFDLLSVGTEMEYPDRLGVPRKSWAGFEAAFAQFLLDSGFEAVYVQYATGAVVLRPTQLVQREGELYRVTNQATLPLGLTGNWATDAPKLTAVGDKALRLALQELSGSGMVGFSQTGTYPADTVGSRLQAIPAELESVADDLSLEIIASQQLDGPRGGNLQPTVKLAIEQLGEVGRVGIFKTPAELDTRFGPLYYRKSHTGGAELLTSLDRFKPAGAFVTPSTVGGTALKAYYVKPSGSNSAAGTSWDTALASVAVAYQKGDADVIFVAPGVYFNTFHLGTYSLARNLSIQGVGPGVYFVSGPATGNLGAWTATATAGVYKQGVTDSTLSGVVSLDHSDSIGNPYALKKVGGIAEVGASPGSWFRNPDTGELFVSMPDMAAPPARVFYYQGAPMRVTAAGVKFHHRNITYVGGNAGAFSARLADSSTVIYGEDIGAVGQSSGDGYQIKDVGYSIAVRVRASRNFNDGLNYHALNGLTPHFIEIDCIGADNFAEGTGNGSTAHEDVKGFRFNSHYFGNRGPGVADVNDAKTYNVGCTSRANGVGNSNASGFQASSEVKTGSGVTMWLDGCVADGNSGGDFVAKNGAKIFYRDIWSGSDSISLAGDSTAEPFSP
ncbi:hypothetical protein [Stutzerimonas nitrititolerans]|uniref:hypothetical protein n=1 Tax=Stutzerimonas nitrititolerans TaxID=2482751 RepID=UPI0028A9FE84|nr:hypothetical protein [Stutzerimonas nitrititolerans]